MKIIAASLALLVVTACGSEPTWQDELTAQVIAESDGSECGGLEAGAAVALALVTDTTVGDWPEDDRYPYIPDDTPMAEVVEVSIDAMREVCE